MATASETKRAKPTTCRMFDTPFIEFFSNIHPASPFIFWLPVLVALSGWTLAQGMMPLTFAGLVVVGWLAWTLAEYLLHRYVFHAIGPRPWQRRLHFVFHGVHHDFPQDSRRLVMPLGVSIPLGLVFFVGVDALLLRATAFALFVGFGLGYLLYDGIHYFTHHLPARRRIGKFLKRYHLVHHHTGVEGKWGVSTPLWDYVFGSRQERAH
jgi:sterol desaturase/sphingolipid hydroxylase (fatty acid hydroxylase superfamily)